MESVVYQSGRPILPYVCYLHGYQAHSPKFTGNVRWSFLLFQDGVSLACSFPPSVPEKLVTAPFKIFLILQFLTMHEFEGPEYVLLKYHS